jgi:hypothetical protein
MIIHCGLDCLKKIAQVYGLNLKGDSRSARTALLQRKSTRTSMRTGRVQVKYLEREFL